MTTLKLQKPTPPTWSELEKDQQAAAAARALGFELQALPSSTAERIYTAAVELARELKRPVRPQEIHGALKDVPKSSVSSALANLTSAGRLMTLGRGLYLPVIPEARG